MSQKNLLIYALVCPNDGAVKYVGKTSRISTRSVQHIKGEGIDSKRKWSKELMRNKKKPIIVVLEDGVSPEESKLAEKKWINFYKVPNQNYMAIMPQTREEKIKMYGKCKKSELINMLIAANEALDSRPIQVDLGNNIDNTVTHINPDTPFTLTTATTNGYPVDSTISFTY